MTIDVSQHMPKDGAAAAALAVTPILNALRGSAILALAARVRKLKAGGANICDLTVGDFSSKQFPIPASLEQGIEDALRAGHTNYPPADGVPELKEAVAALYKRELGLDYPSSGVVIGGGARPPLYACWRLFAGPGDRTISFVPSWNNGYYAHLTSADHRFVPTTAANNFFPTADAVRAELPGARLIMLNSPLNPTGTAIAPDVLADISQAIVDENRRRAGQPPVMLCYDQVYWMLTFGETRHVNPVALVPEIAPYVVHVDAISKSFAATGVRVGWAVMPPYLAPKMAALVGHMGAWAPRAEQIAAAHLLNAPEAMAEYRATMRAGVEARLNKLYVGISDMKANGLPVDAIRPQGGIYLSFHVDLIGRGFSTNSEIANFLIDEAGVAIVPFQAFDLEEDSGWFRMSVGAVSVEELDGALERIEAAIRRRAG